MFEITTSTTDYVSTSQHIKSNVSVSSLHCKMACSIKSYLSQKYSGIELRKIESVLSSVTKIDFSTLEFEGKYSSYDSLQRELATLNEKCEHRKLNGVYYTPDDIVEFILINSIKFFFNQTEDNKLNKTFPYDLPYERYCYECTFFDPTCGSGVFLLKILEMKLNYLEKNIQSVNIQHIYHILSTLYGNDVNVDSILITKLRLFLCVLERYGIDFAEKIKDILDKNFFQYDFLSDSEKCSIYRYDIIVGNPPYVEDSKIQSTVYKKYGNVYANVLYNSAQLLSTNGVMGFIIPLSYVSTPRMKKIREELLDSLSQQYILSFSDRPDCLFVSVHQKLCVLFAGKRNNGRKLLTSNYQYWYKEERENLFDNIEVVSNNYYNKDFIPKIGTILESQIYEKILLQKKSLSELFVSDGEPLYLNMRSTYWIKAFLNEHSGKEYKIFKCRNSNDLSLAVMLLNSSLFWWYWVCVSDCWHITNKEIVGFRFPEISNFERVENLIEDLENRLENTKVYVGTKQTEYEYKHKFCLEEIHRIDDYVNELYSLNSDESFYIKNFAYRYRTGGGVKV